MHYYQHAHDATVFYAILAGFGGIVLGILITRDRK